MSTPVTRVRFAPSPTGYFHVGGAGTALTNWLVARQSGGTFILRIEDTDRERGDASWTAGILAAMEWLELDWDEGPYFQSERSALYAAAAQHLFDSGNAYACACTRAEVEARTGSQNAGYDGFCRDRKVPFGAGVALRFRVPHEGTTVVSDIIRGEIAFQNSVIEDFVIVKSNGDPIFVLANVVDDQDMAITHVIRGEEHLPTTPKAVLLWSALGDSPLPVYAHLPLLVNERRQKLSKRRDRVAVEDYRKLGFLSEAMVNYLGILGWSPGGDEEEILSRDELVARFRLDEVSHSPAFFDEKRLLHFNGIYIRALSVDEFIERSVRFLAETDRLHANFDQARFERVAPLVQQRVATLADVADLVAFLFDDPYAPDDDAYEKAIGRDDGADGILEHVHDELSSGAFDAGTVRAAVESAGERFDRKLAKAQAPVRVATMGKTSGLPLFESLELLGREETLHRLELARPSRRGQE